MNSKERIKAIKLLEKLERNPEYAQRLGIQVVITKKEDGGS